MIVQNRSSYCIQTSFAVQKYVSQSSLFSLDTGAQADLNARRYIQNHCLAQSENLSSKAPTTAAKDPFWFQATEKSPHD